ncbi:SDR family oxidoreductase [Oscillatoria amoena NRMC-F 0135]|nr:SDR family oxidoreductase [Oscillatoria laete-virens]MDL5046538.1 SDR family oxidoreductase [Oscillatoria amoena NRMC-F 0135]MDL5054846.1 SDR family oxidoreductase [Oscillatoria laete-virens NRMC-F 0139]
MNQSAILLTGLTGVIGKRVAYRLAERGHTVLCPVRAGSPEQLARRFEQAKSVLREVTEGYDESVAARIRPFAGDLRRDNFGLTDRESAAIGLPGARAIWHLAAALDLTETNRDEVFETNVNGTQRLLNFMAAHGIADMHYFSTFAVHGRRSDGVAREEILSQRADFRNSYEESKWRTEQMVWAARDAGRIRAAIYRPSIVVGDSVHGRYEQFNSFNHAFDMASRLRRKLSERAGIDPAVTPLDFQMRVPGVPSATLNIVPLDYVVETTMRLYDSGQWEGGIFHITNPNPPRLDEMMEIFQMTEPWKGLSWSESVLQGQFANPYEKFACKQLGFLTHT